VLREAQRRLVQSEKVGEKESTRRRWRTSKGERGVKKPGDAKAAFLIHRFRWRAPVREMKISFQKFL